MSFRGHNDLLNGGNLEIVDLLNRWNSVFAEYLENGARNCTYLSNRAQNDLIHAMRNLVLREFSKIFTVIMDETTDGSGRVKASVMVRFVDNENVIQEHLMGLSAVTRTISETYIALLNFKIIYILDK